MAQAIMFWVDQEGLSQQLTEYKRGLASASGETRERVAKAGGEAPHSKRGLQAATPETRLAVARRGGLARGEQRRRARQDRSDLQRTVTAAGSSEPDYPE